MVFNDRLKRALYALFKASVPRLDYYARYSGRVVRQPSPGSLDVQPDDPRIPSMGGVPLKNGIRGLTMDVPPGSSVMIGWENADPARPYCESWAGGETDTISITIVADKITLGSEAGAEPAAKGQTLQSYLNALAAALVAHTHPVSGPLAGPSVPLAVPGAITPPVVTAIKVNVA